MKFIIAKKLEMTQKFNDDGTVVPVTILSVEPCTVTQVKNKEKDGYLAVQVGTGTTKKLAKPQVGHFKPSNSSPKMLREFRLKEGDVFNIGDKITVANFEVGDFVSITGVSKGKGFQGVVKRHHFRGGPASHGHKDNLRMPGSIGSGGMQRVFKGLKMGGHMGTDKVTVKNLKVVSVDVEKNTLMVRGAVPGFTRGTVYITSHSNKRTSWK